MSGTSTWFPYVIVFVFAVVIVGGILAMAWFFFRRPAFAKAEAVNTADFPDEITADSELDIVERDAKHGVNLDSQDE